MRLLTIAIVAIGLGLPVPHPMGSAASVAVSLVRQPVTSPIMACWVPSAAVSLGMNTTKANNNRNSSSF
jgi:hypothetical protein